MRPLAQLNRSRWANMLKNPSKFHVLTSKSGKATQKRFLDDLSWFMDVIVSETCFVSYKVGSYSAKGFRLRTWQTIADKTGFPEWRVKQLYAYAKDKGWMTSLQPRGFDEKNGEYYGQCSIKRVTKKYFQDLGMMDAYTEAKKKATEYLKKAAEKANILPRLMLTPFTLIQKFTKRRTQSQQEALRECMRESIPI